VQAKIALLAKLAFGVSVPLDQISTKGISSITRWARGWGCGGAGGLGEWSKARGPLAERDAYQRSRSSLRARMLMCVYVCVCMYV
jgi:homoserine dehydrogenase